jgi:hypothetical protein
MAKFGLPVGLSRFSRTPCGLEYSVAIGSSPQFDELELKNI